MFSTASHDNDMADDFNCAASLRPWWHDRCFLCSLFGLYGEYPIIPDNKGIKWMYTGKIRKVCYYDIRPN
ncbi:hypothetical protein LSH36_1845g00041 [Paralvinella palmiformis]|uniref:Fibrinogen C-terminal domain-containing protein n=1 Tax=Paralvinella palmiformis TaxID=53620 RepID=A0AAD9MQM0_9ANNE|nr:hypothetical protein LSH36_1845g00041 [Paralvinella palmiformis]